MVYTIEMCMNGIVGQMSANSHFMEIKSYIDIDKFEVVSPTKSTIIYVRSIKPGKY